MSQCFVDRRHRGRARPRVRVAGLAVLASITLAGVTVSVASAGAPPAGPVPAPPVMDEHGNTALEVPETAGGGYIVQVEDGANLDDVVAEVTEDGVDVTGTMEGAIDAFTAPLDAQAVSELRARHDVVRVERQRLFELDGVQDSPPWGLDRIDQRALPLDTKYSSLSTGAGVDVYVVDSGIHWTHSDFTGRIKPGAFVDFGDNNGVNDCDGHGTHVAGTVGGTTWGVAKAVSIVPVNVFMCGVRATVEEAIILGINWVVEKHQAGEPAVANLSINGPASAVADDAVRALVADGITVVTAAGNDSTVSSCDRSPARIPEVITVAASDSTDARGSFSSPGSCNDLFAPGVDIRSADYQSDTGSVLHTGTSMATPHVAGAAALILQQNPTYTPTQVWAEIDGDTTKGAITGEGTGDPDKLLHIKPEPKVPSAPTGLTAAVPPAAGVGPGEVKLTWTAPSDTGTEPITDYVVEKSPMNLFSWSTVYDGISTATTTTVRGLTNGTPYWFRVSARSSAGVGPAANSISATPAWVPDAPTGLTAEVAPAPGVGSGQVKLTWTAPSSTGGSAITDYVLQRSGDGTTWTTVVDGVSPATSFTFGGLTNGTRFYFRVAAVNAPGAGPWSATVSATPVGQPGAVSSLTAAVTPTAGVSPGQVKLTWNAPSLTGGTAITDYLIQWSVDGTTWTTVADGTSPSTGVTIGELTNGTRHSFRVAAVNKIGAGPWSTTVSATPAGPPGAASSLTAAVAPTAGVSPGQVKLTWTAPSSTGGSAITDYVIQSSVDGTTWTTVDDGLSTATGFTVVGLTGGTSYSFRVAATNGLGTGPWSAAVSAIPATEPAAPTGLSAAVAPAAGPGEVKLAWTAPAGNGSAITDYVIQRSLDGATWTLVADGVSAATSSTMGGLTGGSTYTFRVAATNGLGTGPWSATVTATPASVAAAPSGLMASVWPAVGVGSGEVELAWTAPAGNGSTITDYVIQRSLDGATWTAFDDGVSAATTSTVGGLTGDTAYTFRVAAKNGAGTGAWSTMLSATPVSTPVAPTGLMASVWPAVGVGSREVKLAWGAPGNGGSALTDYVIQSSTDGVAWTTVDDGASTATGFTLTGLTGGTSYSFRVAARNALGAGSWSATVTATPVGPPAAPTALVAAVAPTTGVGSAQVKLTWSSPKNGGSAITDYRIQRSTDAVNWTTVADGISSSPTVTVTGLTNGRAYRFRIAAVNAVGSGPWSASATAVPRWKPAAPSALRAVAGTRRVTLYWKAPASNGAAITDYVIHRSPDGKRWTTVRDGVSTARSTIVTGLTNGVPYRFRVAAKNAVGLGPWSATVRSTPRAG